MPQNVQEPKMSLSTFSMGDNFSLGALCVSEQNANYHQTCRLGNFYGGGSSGGGGSRNGSCMGSGGGGGGADYRVLLLQ